MQRLKPLLLSGIIGLIANACGQAGPLYLPDQEQSPPQAPQEQIETPETSTDKDKEDKGSHEENP